MGPVKELQPRRCPTTAPREDHLKAYIYWAAYEHGLQTGQRLAHASRCSSVALLGTGLSAGDLPHAFASPFNFPHFASLTPTRHNLHDLRHHHTPHIPANG